MWMLFVRTPLPDRPYWRGRCSLAAVDALAWPGLWLVAIRSAPADLGLVGAFACACVIVAAAQRLWIAVWQNHRYHFTTWRWGKAVAWLLLFGMILKLAMAA